MPVTAWHRPSQQAVSFPLTTPTAIQRRTLSKWVGELWVAPRALKSLRGPKGEMISYRRTGPLLFGGVILDIYEIKELRETLTLYVDEYSHTGPKAPVGFTCVSAFPLTEPE